MTGKSMNEIQNTGITTYFSHVYGGKRKQNSYGDDNRYPRYPKFTINDKKIINSRYSPTTTKITKKIIMLFICVMILTLILAQIYSDKNDYITIGGIVIISGFMVVPFFYVMVKSYYMYILYFIIILILGMMGYGWGIFSIMMNLKPGNIINNKSNNRNNLK